MKINLLSAAACGILLASLVNVGAQAQQQESKTQKKGESLVNKGEQTEEKAQKQIQSGHPLRAGHLAKKAAKEEARGERKLKKAGVPAEPTAPAQQ